MNEAIELELQIFKEEIEERFAKSAINKNYVFPKTQTSDSQIYNF